MGHAGIEPDIEDIGHFIVIRCLIADQLLGRQIEPGIHPRLCHQIGGFMHQGHGIGMRFSGLLVDEQGDRHAPGALARNAPIRPAVNHAGDAGLAPIRNPTHAVDGFQGGIAQAGLLHGNEPLRRGAERDR